MRNWKTIIFDMGGTLFDTEIISTKAQKRMGETLQLPTSDESILSPIGRTREDQQVTSNSYMPKDWPQEKTCSLHTQFKKERRLKNGVLLMGDAKGLLDIVKAKGYTIAMATSASAEDVEFNLNSTDIQHYSEVIISDGTITHGKPAPDVYLKTAQQLNLSPRECLIVENSLNDVRVAFGTGTTVVMAPDKIQPTKEIKATCNYILKNLDDLKEIVRI